MKNKRLLKCLSISALASLFVAPIILNSTYIDKVDDNVSGINEQKKLSNDVNYDDEISPQASITYSKVDLHSKFVGEQHCANSSYQTYPTLDSEGPIYANVCNGQWTSGGKFYYAKYFDGLVSGRNYRVTYKVLTCGFEDEFIGDDEGYNDSCTLIFGGTNDPTKRYKRYFVSHNLEEAEIKYASSFKESDLDIYSSYQKEVLNTFNDSKIIKTIYQVKALNENDVLNNKEELIN